MTSRAPSFLEGALHQPSPALAGAVSFTIFASAALAQTLSSSRSPQQLLATAIPVLLAGVALLTLALCASEPGRVLGIDRLADERDLRRVGPGELAGAPGQ